MSAASVVEWLVEVRAQGGVGLHLAAGEPPRVRLPDRIERLGSAELGRLDEAQTIDLIESVLDTSSRDALRRSGWIEVAPLVDGVGRVHVVATRRASAVWAFFRLASDRVATMEELALPSSLGRVLAQPGGLVLIAGLTGSGRSATLSALLQQVGDTSVVSIIDDSIAGADI